MFASRHGPTPPNDEEEEVQNFANLNIFSIQRVEQEAMRTTTSTMCGGWDYDGHYRKDCTGGRGVWPGLCRGTTCGDHDDDDARVLSSELSSEIPGNGSQE